MGCVRTARQYHRPDRQADAASLGVPRVAIGGITTDNAGQVVAAGADAIAVIGGLFNGDGIAERAATLAALYS